MVWNLRRALSVQVVTLSEMKRLLFYSILILLVATDLSAQRSRKKDLKELGAPYFSVSAPGYPTETVDFARLDVYVRVPYDAIQFIKKGDKFEAKYEVAITLLDKDDDQIKRQIKEFESITSYFTSTVSPREGDLSAQSFKLSPGKYTCIVEVTDKDTHKTGRRKVKVDLTRMGEEGAISDLILLNPNNKGEDHPMGLPVIPPRTFENDSTVHIYYEARLPKGTESLFVRLLSVGDEVLEEDTIDVSDKEMFTKDIIERELAATVSSRFKLELSLEKETDKDEDRVISELVIQNLWRGMTAFVNDLDDAIEQLRYIAYSDEMKKLNRSKEDKKEDNFRTFWANRDPTPDTPKNELMDEYYRRIQYSNEKFGTWQGGWKTAMGMIFILFGPPDDIEVNMYGRDGRHYQRWTYFKISRSFTFVDYNGFGEYELMEPYVSPYGSRWR